MQRAESGISLLELSIVILLISIIMGFTLPSFGRLFESPLQIESKKLVQLLQSLRHKAILRGESYLLIFRLKTNQIEVYLEDRHGKKKRHPSFSDPIEIQVKLAAVEAYDPNSLKSRFDFEPIQFERIFGQDKYLRIDHFGLMDLLTIKLQEESKQQILTIENVMGKITLSSEQSL